MLGLIVDLSHAGCSTVFLRSKKIYDKLIPDVECLVQAGSLHPMRAVIRWRNNLDEDLFKVGFQFLE